MVWLIWLIASVRVLLRSVFCLFGVGFAVGCKSWRYVLWFNVKGCDCIPLASIRYRKKKLTSISANKPYAPWSPTIINVQSFDTRRQFLPQVDEGAISSLTSADCATTGEGRPYMFGEPWAIPGYIEAEFYDYGGPGVRGGVEDG